MKLFLSFILSLSALHISAQAGFHQAETQIKNFARFCATYPWEQNVVRSDSRFEKTHTLDSIVLFDGGGTYIGKTEVVYDPQLRTSVLTQYGLDSAETEVLLQSIITLEYDDIDLPSHIAIQFWNTDTKELEIASEIYFFYDGMERVDSLVLHSIDPFSGEVIPLSASKQVYSGSLLVQTRQWFYFSILGSWIPSSTTDYMYDGQDRLIEKETEIVDFFTMVVIPESRTTYSYNAQGLQDLVTEFVWSGTAWDPAQRFMYEYYGNGTLSSETRQIYSNGQWVNNVWTMYHVEKAHDTYPYTSYIWDPLDGAWEKTDSVINLLNPALLFEQVVTPTELEVLNALGEQGETPFLAEGPSIDEIQYFFFDTLSQSFFATGDDVYYYSQIKGSAVYNALPDYITVSPNPASDQFNIELDLESTGTYTVFSNGAVALKRGELNRGHNSIGTSGWSPGMYFVVIHLNNGKAFVHKQSIE